jgi:hypothetical protein
MVFRIHLNLLISILITELGGGFWLLIIEKESSAALPSIAPPCGV